MFRGLVFGWAVQIFSGVRIELLGRNVADIFCISVRV